MALAKVCRDCTFGPYRVKLKKKAKGSICSHATYFKEMFITVTISHFYYLLLIHTQASLKGLQTETADILHIRQFRLINTKRVMLILKSNLFLTKLTHNITVLFSLMTTLGVCRAIPAAWDQLPPKIFVCGLQYVIMSSKLSTGTDHSVQPSEDRYVSGLLLSLIDNCMVGGECWEGSGSAE